MAPHPITASVFRRLTMKLLGHLTLTSILSVMFAGIASATPIPAFFSLDSIVVTGAAFPVTQTISPGPPVVGGGSIDVALGTGTVNLPVFTVTVDVFSDLILDAAITTTGWSQALAFSPGGGAGIPVTSVGAGMQTCMVLGAFGGAVCGAFSPTVAGWPPVPGSALIDTVAQTIVIADGPNPTVGTITTSYSWSVVPEPGTALLLGLGLAGVGVVGRSKRQVRKATA